MFRIIDTSVSLHSCIYLSQPASLQSADTLSEPHTDNSFFLGQGPFSFFCGGRVHFVWVFLKYLKKMKCTHIVSSGLPVSRPNHGINCVRKKHLSQLFLHSTVYVLYIFRTLFFSDFIVFKVKKSHKIFAYCGQNSWIAS
jgi:hypothetical protein